METQVEGNFSYKRDWQNLSPEAKNLSIFLAHLRQSDTHSDSETLEQIMGLKNTELEQKLKELRIKGLLTQITFRKELEKVAAGKVSDFAPPPYTWTPEQAKKILEIAPAETTLDTLHYRLVPKFQEFVLDEFHGPISKSEVK